MSDIAGLVEWIRRCWKANKGPPLGAKFSNRLLELHVAPKIGSFTEPKIPALAAPNASFSSWFLNNAFVGQIGDDRSRTLVSIFINRVEFACASYTRAKVLADEYVARLSETNAHFAKYREAARLFETCVIHTHIAYCSANRLGEHLGFEKVFEAKDGSEYDRIRILNNRVKHFDEDIRDGTHVGPVPIWLTNDGLECTEARVGFSELADVLNTAAGDAKNFAEDLFREVVERRKKPGETSGLEVPHD